MIYGVYVCVQYRASFVGCCGARSNWLYMYVELGVKVLGLYMYSMYYFVFLVELPLINRNRLTDFFV